MTRVSDDRTTPSPSPASGGDGGGLLPQAVHRVTRDRVRWIALWVLCGALAVALLWAVAMPAQLAQAWPQRDMPSAPPAVLHTDEHVRLLANHVMRAIGQTDVHAAYSAMLPHTVLSSAELNRLFQDATKQRASEAFVQRYGQTLGFEFVTSTQPSESLMRLSYIERSERQPIPWTFYFYRRKSVWVLSDFSWGGHLFEFFRNL